MVSSRDEQLPPRRARKPKNGASANALLEGDGRAAVEREHEGLSKKQLLAALVAFRRGDFSVRLPAEFAGTDGRIVECFNDVIELNQRMSAELARISEIVGEQGRISQRASIGEVRGGWHEAVSSVNALISNLVQPTSDMARVIGAVAKGDLSQTMSLDVEGRALEGEFLRAAKTVNLMVDQLGSFASEVTRVAREVGTEGKLGGQAKVKGVAGTWKDLTDSVNSMAGNLTAQVRNIAAVTTAVANGDLSKKITVDVKGEIAELKNTINTMVDQLNSFASEVTRVAREVGTEGKLGGQADVKGVAGTWKDLTDNVNLMASNLTNQVRGIAKVVTAVADGDLNKKLTVDAKGEIAALADTINSMSETLATFADQVTTVAREVGVEGKLGGQALVPSAAGTWKDLTDNVNGLAANLTTQVRAMAEVATAVTKGDLTRFIEVEAQGEVAALKDHINEMVRNLKDTTIKNNEQDWLKTNLAKFSRMLQGQKDLLTVGRLILSELAPVVSAQQGVFYVMDSTRDEPHLRLLASYAFKQRKHSDNVFKLGEGLVGQCALEKEKILLSHVPGDYISITSGLGEAAPQNIIVIPVIFENRVKAVLELASFDRFNATHLAFLDQLTESIGIVINTIEANTRTEDLLKQSQSLARELQSQQLELQETNAKLEEKAKLLAEQNAEVERKNKEVEQARQALEEKAAQLALTSKYKNEFLANMSHELRTPLNSLLILSDHLSKNADRNLTARQVEFASTIHASGNELLALINDILDLAKIESGTVVVDVGELSFSDLHEYVERSFRHVAENKQLELDLDFDMLALPRTVQTDAKRLQQVLKNLLSNAFKFTERGRVSMRVAIAAQGWRPEIETLTRARSVVAFTVTDTGIGIPRDKQQIVFEAFQQADGSTSRKYGGTGLGLAITREISRLLGGDIRLVSEVGRGSEFTLYLPVTYTPPRAPRRLGPPQPIDAAPHPTAPAILAEPPAPVVASDWGDELAAGESFVLVVENDPAFASILREVAHDHGLATRVTSHGAIGLGLAQDRVPDAITLDIKLPDIDGWRVLHRLKNDPKTRHVPVLVITTDEDRERGLRMGAAAVLRKPLRERAPLDEAFGRLERLMAPHTRRVLVADSLRAERDQLARLLAVPDVELVTAASADEVRAAMREARFDLLVLGAEVGGLRGVEVAEVVRGDATVADLPVVLFSSGELAEGERVAAERLTRTAVVEHVRSPERLLDEAVLFLHLRHDRLDHDRKAMVDGLRQSATVLAGKSVLVVDDDVRNIFALGTVLEPYEMKVLAAENGRAAIEVLNSQAHVDIVLMDIMMPGMDGYDTMRAIRAVEVLRSVPIVALTAKAMKGDREKCLEAGASDYISKPVDPEMLLSILRLWLYR